MREPFFDEHGVLHDETAEGVIWAVVRENVRRSLAEVHRDRIEHFARRIAEIGSEIGADASDLVIVVLNVDDHNGGQLAEALMPGHDWSQIRARGETPFARGLATRPGLQDLLDDSCASAAAELRGIAGVAVVAMDRGVIAAFGLDQIAKETT